MGDVIVRLLDMPVSVNGMTLMDPDTNYNIYINSRLSADEQRKALEHELEHIRRDDFYNSLPIQEIEEIF